MAGDPSGQEHPSLAGQINFDLASFSAYKGGAEFSSVEFAGPS